MFGAPAYEQVANVLRERISSGELAIGQAIPSTRELSSHFGVSATSARGAVTQLRSEGLVRGQPGKGVFVIATPHAVRSKDAQLQELADRVTRLETSLAEARSAIGRVQGELMNLRSRGAGTRRDLTTDADSAVALHRPTGTEVDR